jgi:preprotein translocase subunit SecD
MLKVYCDDKKYYLSTKMLDRFPDFDLTQLYKNQRDNDHFMFDDNNYYANLDQKSFENIIMFMRGYTVNETDENFILDSTRTNLLKHEEKERENNDLIVLARELKNTAELLINEDDFDFDDEMPEMKFSSKIDMKTITEKFDQGDISLINEISTDPTIKKMIDKKSDNFTSSSPLSWVNDNFDLS